MPPCPRIGDTRTLPPDRREGRSCSGKITAMNKSRRLAMPTSAVGGELHRARDTPPFGEPTATSASSTWRARFYNWRARFRGLNAFRMTESDLLRFCAMLEKWKPPYLTGYASALYRFAQFAGSAGYGHLRFRAIRSSAEMLYPHYRSLIQGVFKSPVFNFYGSREVNNLAAECPENRCLHLISSWRYVEITDEAGRTVPDGETGYITVTDCGNQAMPFIRYRNEDMGAMCRVPCGCGRPTPVLESLLGRSSDLIRTRSGKLIHGEFFTHLFYGRDDIELFQVQQCSKEKLIVRYVPRCESAHSFAHGLREPIVREMGGDVLDRVSCLPVDSCQSERQAPVHH